MNRNRCEPCCPEYADRRVYNCRGTRTVIKHERVVRYCHDIINEYDVIHEHDYNYYDVINERDVVRHNDYTNHCDDNYCREDNCDMDDCDRDSCDRDDCDRDNDFGDGVAVLRNGGGSRGRRYNRYCRRCR